MNLNRTEELEIKKDIKGIKKALENIAHNLSPASTDTESADTESRIPDPFFGKIHMSKEHMDAWTGEFDTTCHALVGFMEECAELQQAAYKYYRHYRNSTHACCAAEKAAMIEEITHVMIDIRMICHDLDITPEEIQQEIYKKYPDGYDVTILFADNKPYYMERTKGSE